MSKCSFELPDGSCVVATELNDVKEELKTGNILTAKLTDKCRDLENDLEEWKKIYEFSELLQQRLDLEKQLAQLQSQFDEAIRQRDEEMKQLVRCHGFIQEIDDTYAGTELHLLIEEFESKQVPVHPNSPKFTSPNGKIPL